MAQVAKVYDQYLNFVTLEDDLFVARHSGRESISYYGEECVPSGGGVSVVLCVYGEGEGEGILFLLYSSVQHFVDFLCRDYLS